MLCGDFNIDLLNKDCNNLTSFLNTMYSLSLLPSISKPTRIIDNSATRIDNFFINEPFNFESGILISDISDHFPIFFNRKNFFCTNSSKNVNKGVHYRLINQNTLSALDEMLALTNFDDIINNDNINEVGQLLFDIESIMLLNYVVLFEQRPYLLKIQLNHGFQVRFVQISIIIIIIYHDFLPTPRRGSHVKSGKTHTQSSRYTP